MQPNKVPQTLQPHLVLANCGQFALKKSSPNDVPNYIDVQTSIQRRLTELVLLMNHILTSNLATWATLFF